MNSIENNFVTYDGNIVSIKDILSSMKVDTTLLEKENNFKKEFIIPYYIYNKTGLPFDIKPSYLYSVKYTGLMDFFKVSVSCESGNYEHFFTGEHTLQIITEDYLAFKTVNNLYIDLIHYKKNTLLGFAENGSSIIIQLKDVQPVEEKTEAWETVFKTEGLSYYIMDSGLVVRENQRQGKYCNAV